MGWGALMGLGQGLQQVGGILTDNNKAKLAAKLEAERDEAKAARDEKLRQLKLTEPDPSLTTYGQVDGAWMEEIRNGKNEIIDRRLAPQSKVKELNFSDEKNRLSLEASTLGNDKARKELSVFDATHSLENKLTEAQIGYYQDRGTAALTNATKPKGGSSDETKLPTSADVAAAMIDNNKAIIEQFDIDPSVAKTIADRLAPQLIEQAKAGNVKDPSALFLQALREIKSGKVAGYKGTPSYGKETF